jgi:hypothetical protein
LNQIISGLQAQTGSSKLTVLLNMAVENFVGGILISVPLVSSGLSYSAFGWLSGYWLGAAFIAAFLTLVLITAGFGRALIKRIRLLHLYILMNLGLYLFWLPNVSYDRFLMPMLPFLQLFLVCELGVLSSLARKGLQARDASGRLSGALITVVLVMVVGITFYGYGSGTHTSLASLRTSADRAADDAEAISWLKEHSSTQATLVCYRDPKYFLFTGHKAVRSFPMTEGFSWEEDPASMAVLAQAVFGIIEEAGARFVVVTATDFELEDRPEQRRKTFDALIEQHPDNFVLVFRSAEGRSRIYRIAESAK